MAGESLSSHLINNDCCGFTRKVYVSYHILNKTSICPQISVKISNIKFHKKSVQPMLYVNKRIHDEAKFRIFFWKFLLLTCLIWFLPKEYTKIISCKKY